MSSSQPASNLLEHANQCFEDGDYPLAAILYNKMIDFNQQAPELKQACSAGPARAEIIFAGSKYRRVQVRCRRSNARRQNLPVIVSNRDQISDAQPAIHPNAMSLPGMEPVNKETNVLMSQAEMLFKRGDYQAAEWQYQKALPLLEGEIGAGHPRVASALMRLAAIYRMQRRWGEAELLCKQTILAGEHACGTGQFADCLHELSTLYRVQGRYVEAEALCLQAFAIRKEILDPGHAQIADSMISLALINHALGRHGQAEPLYKQALAIHENGPGGKHLAAFILNRLANLCMETGRSAEAELLYKGVIAMDGKGLEADHPEIITARQNYEFLLGKRSRQAAANCMLS